MNPKNESRGFKKSNTYILHRSAIIIHVHSLDSNKEVVTHVIRISQFSAAIRISIPGSLVNYQRSAWRHLTYERGHFPENICKWIIKSLTIGDDRLCACTVHCQRHHRSSDSQRMVGSRAPARLLHRLSHFSTPRSKNRADPLDIPPRTLEEQCGWKMMCELLACLRLTIPWWSWFSTLRQK